MTTAFRPAHAPNHAHVPNHADLAAARPTAADPEISSPTHRTPARQRSAAPNAAPIRLARRAFLLAGTASLVAAHIPAPPARAEPVSGGMPWSPDAGAPPSIVRPGPWAFFDPEEGRAIEAIVDRLIPADDLSAGGTECGCAVYIDRQLAGPYGKSLALYMNPPFRDGTKSQGDQSPLTPATRYRQGLHALDTHCRAAAAGKSFADLPPDRQDHILHALEDHSLQLDGASGHAFFRQVLNDTQQGFLADPIYGGNRDMVSWRMIGFPGARYDYRDWISRHNEPYPYPPTSIGGEPGWTDGKGDRA